MAEDNSRPMHRVCTKCDTEKPLEAFSKATGGKYGLSARCRACAAAYASANQKRINELSLARYHRLAADKKAAKEVARAARLAAVDKKCARCGEAKPKAEFKAKKDSADGLHCHCKQCCNAINREHRVANPEMAAAWTKKWAGKNRDKVEAKRKRWIERNPGRQTELARKWREENPERFRETQKRHTDQPHVRIHSSIRQRLRQLMLKGSRRTFEILGYSRDELIVHLERQFLPGMTWDNYGEWHVDHIRPLASFKISSIDDELVREAWSLSNLRPIWAKDNFAKSAKRIFLI